MKKVLFFLFLVLVFLTAGRVFAVGTIEINTASLQQLEQITGVGPVIAQRIIDARPFSSVDDLTRVKGIGDKTLQKIKDQGLAYIEGQAQQPAPKTIPPQPITQPATTPSTTTNPVPAITYPDGIIINEILPAPEGADETNEWIELHNTTATVIDVSGWKLQDIQGTTAAYVLPKDTLLAANAYVVLKRPDTKIILNNDTDGLNLMQPDGKIINSVSYINAPINQSYNNTPSGWQWSTTSTAGAVNTITAVALKIKTAAKTKTAAPATLPKTQKTDSNKPNNSIAAASLTNAPLHNNQTSSPWLLFLTALGIFLTFAGILLFLNIFKKHKNPDVQ